MKTAMEIEAQINKIIAENVALDKDDKYRKQAEKQIAFLKKCLLYLENEPSREFLEKEYMRLGYRMQAIDDGFETWKQRQDIHPDILANNPVTKYRQEMKYNAIKKQIETIRFLLA